MQLAGYMKHATRFGPELVLAVAMRDPQMTRDDRLTLALHIVDMPDQSPRRMRRRTRRS